MTTMDGLERYVSFWGWGPRLLLERLIRPETSDGQLLVVLLQCVVVVLVVLLHVGALVLLHATSCAVEKAARMETARLWHFERYKVTSLVNIGWLALVRVVALALRVAVLLPFLFAVFVWSVKLFGALSGHHAGLRRVEG